MPILYFNNSSVVRVYTRPVSFFTFFFSSHFGSAAAAVAAWSCNVDNPYSFWKDGRYWEVIYDVLVDSVFLYVHSRLSYTYGCGKVYVCLRCRWLISAGFLSTLDTLEITWCASLVTLTIRWINWEVEIWKVFVNREKGVFFRYLTRFLDVTYKNHLSYDDAFFGQLWKELIRQVIVYCEKVLIIYR